jgi:hypothetical protein
MIFGSGIMFICEGQLAPDYWYLDSLKFALSSSPLISQDVRELTIDQGCIPQARTLWRRRPWALT